ncbi:D-threo-aldose 1-dehydrogenase [Diaminobutyricimonas aerilata]|uniref:D-threo-aldose 1-dehydrogenase n=1 Tax=Diaminobutyricimonas aerilata TaxID=1162967 RepID=A0A2M9CN67_9MICO|nr:aldo/keto reductase [Diaminobutyricimonas aerilata]PJJ73340.1 D-threo-aldose 1-dehydrogenase [Diaminobutyricimonas aerilata]
MSRLGLPAVGYGVAGLGNLYSAMPEEEWPRCVPAAWDAGIRYFDVAPHYGLGLAEERLGASLAAYPRDEYVVSTKVGRVLEPNPDYEPGQTDIDSLFDVPATRRRVYDYSRDGVLRSIEQSLERMGLDRLDIVLVHDPDDHEREALDGAFPALDELRSQGVIRAYGAGMNQSAMLTRFVERTDLDVVMMAGRYTLLEDGAAHDLLPAAAARGVDVLAAAVFNSGVLATPRIASDARYNYGAVPEELRRRVDAIADIAERHGCTVPQLAAQYPLRASVVSTVVLGAKSAEQVRANAALVDAQIPMAVWDELESAGLVARAL